MIVTSIIGARPQFVKAAVVSRALQRQTDVKEILVHTGQHYDANMSDVFFKELEIPHPNYHLGIGSGPHGEQTGRMLEAIEIILQQEKPDTVLVYGDTNSTLAGALAAAKLHIPVAHVEAGLRSFNRRMPEEINRVMTDHLSSLLFAPTDAAVRNLKDEGITGEHVQRVGDVMYDATLYYREKARQTSQIVERLGLVSCGYVLATIHRAENTDDPVRLKTIMEGIAQASDTIPVVLPLHPRTRQALRRLGLEQYLANFRGIQILDPVGYLDMTRLEAEAATIVTDSGGVQKEAYFHRIPCVTLREETEWVELVETGWNQLCPAKTTGEICRRIIDARDRVGTESSLYGNGAASQTVAASLCRQQL